MTAARRHPPFPATESRLRRQLQWVLFLRLAILTLLLGVNLLVSFKAQPAGHSPFHYLGTFIAGVYVYTLLSAVALRFLKRHRLFAYGQILVDCLLITGLVYLSGGNKSLFLSLYFFPIIAGSFLLLVRGGVASAGLATLSLAAILLAEYFDYHPSPLLLVKYDRLPNLIAHLNFFSFHGITFFFVAILSTLLADRLRRTETALDQTTQEFDRLSSLHQQIVQDINTGILTVSGGGTITSVNRALEKISGYGRRELVGRNLAEVFPGLEVHRMERMRPAIDLERKGGEKIPVGYSCALLHFDKADTDSLVVTVEDMRELRAMEEQMRQSEKLATIGKMAAGIAHEFRNPLAAISGSAQILLKDQPTDTTNRMLTEIIVRECERLETTISEFLYFSKPALPEKSWFSLPLLVDEVVMLLKKTRDWREGVEIHSEIPEQTDCWGDAQLIRHVLINLVHNAMLAMGDRPGRITLQVGVEEAGDEAEQMVLSVADTGPGIPAEILPKIFDPFFTTRENGTGLGLAIVRQILEGHGATISAESLPGQGARFRIELPLP